MHNVLDITWDVNCIIAQGCGQYHGCSFQAHQGIKVHTSLPICTVLSIIGALYYISRIIVFAV